MSRIQKLPEKLIQCIAAGEVVERPSSVLKELVENAIDAESSRIQIEWLDAGRKKIKISDDGCGMTPEEARLSFERHATSKISTLSHLENIETFGFRGEALPSIAAVSRFELITRTKESPEAWRIKGEGGKILSEGPCGAPVGTTIIIDDLFFNTPARKKFLKSDTTEKGLLMRTVEDLALSADQVHFHVLSEKKEILNLRGSKNSESPGETLYARLQSAWGKQRLINMKPIHESGRFIKVWGWISDIHSHQASSRYQRFYVNGRSVSHRRLTRVLYDAYKGRLMVGRHPSAVLFLEVNPTLVDVNVHPSKKEVRISQENEVYSFLYKAIQRVLADQVDMPTVFQPDSQTPAVPPVYPKVEKGFSLRRNSSFTKNTRVAENQAAYKVQAPSSDSSVAAAAITQEAYPEGAGNALPLSKSVFKEAGFEILMQLDRTYIVTRLKDQMVVFDQHAAAERVLYEKLSEAAQNKHPHRQSLLLPWVWEVSSQAASIVHDQLEAFTKLGYDLEPFGAQSFRVKAVPGALGDSSKVKNLLEELVDDLLSEIIPRNWDAIITRAACRGSVKANDVLMKPEMEQIIMGLKKCDSPWSCPHGRPTFLQLSPHDLAKRFRRV